ncbi:hypothetical protein Bca101_071333 [Brassica carinata]
MERVTTLSVYSRRRLCLLSSSPSEERWKPTTIDDLTTTTPSSVIFGVRGTMERATTLSVYSVALSDGSHDLFNFQINYRSSVRKISLSAILERKKSPNRLYRF